MNYQRILMLVDLGADAQPACEAIRRFAPSAVHVTVIAQQPTRLLGWVTPAAPPDLNDAAQRTLDDLRQAAERTAPAVDVAVESELSADALVDAVATCDIDLVVVGDVPLRTLSIVAELRKRSALPVLCVRSAYESSGPEGGSRMLCVDLSSRGRAAVVNFIRDHASPQDRIVLLSSEPLSSDDLLRLREVSDIPPEVSLTAAGPPVRYLLDPQVREGFDLVVLPRFPPVVSLAARSGPPVFVLPPLRPAGVEWERAIDVPDLVDDGALIRARVEYAVGVGRRTPIADQEVAFVRASEIVARTAFCQGEAELPSGLGTSLGVFRTRGKDPTDPLAAVEGRVAVLRPGTRTLILFDAEIDNDQLPLIRRVTWADAVGVRVRSMRSCTSLRARLRAAGLPPCVIDAGTVLGEGDALDVPALADAVRLARVAARMRADGFPVAAVVYRGPHTPATRGFAALRPEELTALPPASVAVTGRASLAERLNVTTGSQSVGGNTIEVELHNPTARAWLLSAIDGSRQRLHFQVYMALDDDVGRPVEAALAAAAVRGVAVRVLVDSLHGLHGSLGAHNPILDRLSSRPGIDFRVWKPITGVPSLEDLKQRDHRKLVVADGQVALLGGRNLSHEYYAGFDEVALTPEMTWRMVPWLDAGARVQGPAVTALERSFLQAWTDAGGDPFDISTPAAAGPTTARVVVHRGLRDAYSIEAYLALIETARSHIYAVNGFPLQLEIQHALLRAIRRGVRVQTLFGNLTPRHQAGPFKGPWSGARTAATSFVHSRMDALVAAGGECYEFVVRHRPEWDPEVGDVWPHVHAKIMSADGRACAVGSANLDVTAGYWESELLLVVEDETVAGTVEARFDELIAASVRVDRNDPEWLRRAEQREWMRHWPGTLSG
jgi:phosphatidylserine/phosphatidylglycerophosphate/cardiolipin synthase-like enzyme